MSKISIYVGRIHACPDVCKRGKLGYHIVNGEERTDRDFVYGLDKSSLIKRLNGLAIDRENILFVNGLPKKVREGWAPDYVFRRLSEEDFKEIVSLEDRSKLSA